MIDPAECIEQAWQVVAGEVGHQAREFRVGARVDQPRHVALIADIVVEASPPRRAPLKHQGGVELIGTIGDPLAQALAARLAERGLQQRAVFEDDDVPAEVAEQRLVACPQALADHRVEALAVIVDDPPAIAQALLPAFEDRLENIAFVEFGVAHERDHAAFRPIESPAVGAHVILHQAREQRLRDPQADRAGGEIDVVGVLGAGGITLRALVAAEAFELLAGLAAQQVLNGMVDRARVRLHRDPILRPQHVEIERGHDGRERSRRRLMPADFEPIRAFAHVVRVVNGPGGEPEDLLFQFPEGCQARIVGHLRSVGLLDLF